MQHDLLRAQAAAEHCDLMLAIGTTLVVYPIAGVVPIAKRAGARVVILTPSRRRWTRWRTQSCGA